LHQVLDLRVYRTAFLPALVALFVAAFSLADRPAALPSPLAADAFDGARAMATLHGLAHAFPDRRAGTAGDVGLAGRIARTLGARDPRTGTRAFAVQRLATQGRTAHGRRDLVTVVATRPGLSSRRIVVLAHRDALDRPGPASLSGTAALLELARVFRDRDLTKTLVLVSTSGATTGFAGARAWAETAAGGPVDAVLVLGDLAGRHVRKPWVVPWRADAGPPPLRLERTVQAAVRAETARDAGGTRAVGQWARRALPFTVSEQGPIGAEDLPAVLLSVSGERGPAAGEPVSQRRLGAFGRAALRAVTAVDAAGRSGGEAPLSEGPRGIVTMRNVLPDWAVRLLVGTLLAPALLLALDGFFRARRRHVPVGPWLRWLAIAATPVLAAWLWARLLGFTGALPAPDGPVLPYAFPLGIGGAIALVSLVPVGAGACWAARALPGGTAVARGAAAAGGLGTATGLLACTVAAVAWIFNPYAAALLLPAAHLWLFAAAPESRLRGRWAPAAVAGGLLLPALLVLYVGRALDLGPLKLAWTTLLAAASGAGLGSTILLAGLVSALAGVVRVLLARRRLEHAAGAPAGPDIRTRGPLSYAGPGSLGGTESALKR
jgi:Peptidase family M28